MRLLLLQDVWKLGHLGDVVEVAPGYARNYLFPKRLATEPTEENVKAIKEQRKAAAAERALRLRRYTDLIEQLAGASVTIEAAANPEGTLYGSVGEKEIAAALSEQGFPIQPEHVVLDRHIRTLDYRMVTLEFTEDITTEVKVWVVREGETPHDDDAHSSDEAGKADHADDTADDQ